MNNCIPKIIENLNEMGKFLDEHKQQKLTQQEKDNLNMPVSNEIELVIKKYSTKKTLRQEDYCKTIQNI